MVAAELARLLISLIVVGEFSLLVVRDELVLALLGAGLPDGCVRNISPSADDLESDMVCAASVTGKLTANNYYDDKNFSVSVVQIFCLLIS